MPVNAHPDSTFSSGVHNDWTQVQLNAEGPSGGNGSIGGNYSVVSYRSIPLPPRPSYEPTYGKKPQEEIEADEAKEAAEIEKDMDKKAAK